MMQVIEFVFRVIALFFALQGLSRLIVAVTRGFLLDWWEYALFAAGASVFICLVMR